MIEGHLWSVVWAFRDECVSNNDVQPPLLSAKCDDRIFIPAAHLGTIDDVFEGSISSAALEPALIRNVIHIFGVSDPNFALKVSVGLLDMITPPEPPSRLLAPIQAL